MSIGHAFGGYFLTAGNGESGIGIRESGAVSRKPGAGSWKPAAKSRKPRIGIRESRLWSRESRANSREPTASSHQLLRRQAPPVRRPPSDCLPYPSAILEGIETAALSIWLTSPYRS